MVPIFHVYICVWWPEYHQLEVGATSCGGHKSQGPVCLRCSNWRDDSTHFMRICMSVCGL